MAIVTKFYQFGTLSSFQARYRKLTKAQILTVIRQIAKAVKVLAKQGYVHCNIQVSIFAFLDSLLQHVSY
jgi:hypothetical protein